MLSIISYIPGSRHGSWRISSMITAMVCILSATTALAHSATASDGQEGKIHDYVFKVGNFDKISVNDLVDVVYTCHPDSAGYAAYRGEEDFCDSFIFTNTNGKLRIQVTTEDAGKKGLPVIHLYSDFLSSAENTSDGTLRIESPAPCPEFSAKQEGNGTVIVENVIASKVNGSLYTGMGTVIISGNSHSANFKMLGTGTIQADRLKSDDVTCRILGSGSIGCWPAATLCVRGIGSTKIYYKGSPEISKKGGGKLIPLPD